MKNLIKNLINTVNTAGRKIIENRQPKVITKFENSETIAAGHYFGKILARSAVLTYAAVKAHKRQDNRQVNIYVSIMVVLAYVDLGYFVIDCNAIKANNETESK